MVRHSSRYEPDSQRRDVGAVRNLLRIAFAFVAEYMAWKLRNTSWGQASFIAYALGLFVDNWFTSQVSRPTPRSRGSSNAGYPTPSSDDAYASAADVLTILGTSLVLMVMADAFFFTTWLDLPAPPGVSGSTGIATVVKIISSFLALAVAFAAPLFVGVFVYVAVQDRLDSRSQTPSGGCLSFLPTALVSLACYGHFYAAFRFYEALGVLRPHP